MSNVSPETTIIEFRNTLLELIEIIKNKTPTLDIEPLNLQLAQLDNLMREIPKQEDITSDQLSTLMTLMGNFHLIKDAIKYYKQSSVCDMYPNPGE